MNTPQDSSLGREVAYPARYDPDLLFPIPRAQGRAGLRLPSAGLPFTGHDRWHAYELAWLDGRGKPVVDTATFLVPADSPQLIESKSLKLYLNSLNASRFDSAEALRERLVEDLSRTAQAPVAVAFGLPPVVESDDAGSIDGQSIDIATYGPPDASLLLADPAHQVSETLRSDLLKSNCPVTGQPDWGSVHIQYQGPRLDRAALLRYLVSFRDHSGFHEQCVERIFTDLLACLQPAALSVEARYTRRGGLDINPWRAMPGQAAPQAARDPRQ
ncbi:NADPH-dependent 7-cyano-7-deazaguanine reductase QueF [Luteimonas sp. A478]